MGQTGWADELCTVWQRGEEETVTTKHVDNLGLSRIFRTVLENHRSQRSFHLKEGIAELGGLDN